MPLTVLNISRFEISSTVINLYNPSIESDVINAPFNVNVSPLTILFPVWTSKISKLFKSLD